VDLEHYFLWQLLLTIPKECLLNTWFWKISNRFVVLPFWTVSIHQNVDLWQYVRFFVLCSFLIEDSDSLHGNIINLSLHYMRVIYGLYHLSNFVAQDVASHWFHSSLWTIIDGNSIPYGVTFLSVLFYSFFLPDMAICDVKSMMYHFIYAMFMSYHSSSFATQTMTSH
jgi:hypothetical protein